MNSIVRKWGEQVIRSRQYAATAALMFAFFSFFDLPVGWLSTVIIALVTLQNGGRQGLIVMAWAILPAVAMLWLGRYELFINVFILHYIVAWGFATILRKHNSWVQVLQLAAGLGIIAVVVLYHFAPEFQAQLVHELARTVKNLKPNFLFHYSQGDIEHWIKYIGLFALGLLGLASILGNLALVFIARRWQAMVVPMINMQKECFSVRMHHYAALTLLVLSVPLYSYNQILFFNVLLVMLVPFIFSGLSLLHAYAATMKNRTIILFIFYMVFLFFSPYIVSMLAMIGWVDSFINFRKRFVADNALIEE